MLRVGLGWLLLIWPLLSIAVLPVANPADNGNGQPVAFYSNMTQQFMPLSGMRAGALENYPVLKVGLFCCSSAPLQSPQWDGKLEGIYPDYLRLLEVVLKRPVHAMLFQSWEQGYQALQRGDIQLLAQTDFSHSEKRASETSPLLVQPLVLMVARRHQNTPAEDLRVLAAPDINPQIIERLRVRYPHLTVAASQQQAIVAVAKNEVDAYLDGQSQIALFEAFRPISAVVNRRDNRIDDLLYGFIGREGDGVAETVDNILTNIPHSITNEIYQRWVSGLAQEKSSDTAIFTPEESAWIGQHPVINVVMDVDNPPYSFLNKNDEITGLDVDIVRLVAEKSGLQINFIPASEPGGVEKALKEEQAQMTPSLLDSPERRRWLSFSQPYSTLEWVMITRNERNAPLGIEQLSHKRIAIQRGHELLAAMQRDPNVSIVEVNTVPEGIDMLLAGAIDATFASAGSASYLQSSRYGSRIFVLPLENAVKPERFAILPAYPLLTDILNKSLTDLAPNELRALRMHWFSVGNLSAYNSTIQPWILFWGGALIVIALCSAFWGISLARQISLRKTADHRLQELLAYWVTLFNNVPTPMFVCGPDMTITAANLWFCREMGRPATDIVGRELFSLQFLSATDEQDVRAIFLRSFSGEMPHFSDRPIILQGVQREGYLWFEGYRNTEGVTMGVIGGWFDVTERKSLARELRLERDKAERGSVEKSAFLARMSHEIRTPLHAIIGILELAVKQQEEPDNPLRIAWQAADSLQGIIGDVLDFSKIEAGNIDINPGRSSLAQVLENCVATFRLRAEQKGLALSLQLGLPEGILHWLDAPRLTQVINNLLLNAIKFTAAGEISVHADSMANGDGDRVTIEVEDSGCGIPPHMYQAVLQPWVRADSAESVPGTGLGLPISAKLVDLMGGTLSLSASDSGGVKVTVQLTLKRAAPEPLNDQVPTEMVDEAETESLNILVVDDLAINLQVLAMQFASSGHYVELVGSGHEALQETERHYYDLILTDCQMQGMDGYTLTGHLREQQQRHHLPPYVIIGCTANAFADERERCLKAGMDEVLTKPLTQKALLEGISENWRRINGGTTALKFEKIRALAQDDAAREHQLLSTLLQGLTEDIAALATDNTEIIEHHAHRMHAAFALLQYYPGMRVCLRIEKTQRFDAQTVETLLKQGEKVVRIIQQH